MKEMKHKKEAEKNGLSTDDYTNHENDDYESKKISSSEKCLWIN